MDEVIMVERIGPNGHEMIPLIGEEILPEQEVTASEVVEEVVEPPKSKRGTRRKTSKEIKEDA